MIQVPAKFGSVWLRTGGLPKPDYYAPGGSGHVNGGDFVVSALDGIAERARDANMEVTASASNDKAAALEVAADADLVIVVGGAMTSEAWDRPNLAMDGGVDDIITEIARTKPVIVLMQIPGAVITPWRDLENVRAVSCLFLGGEQTGRAWAAVLFGDANPSGKLPVAMPATASDVIPPVLLPASVEYGEKLFTSYRSSALRAAYPFGHGPPGGEPRARFASLVCMYGCMDGWMDGWMYGCMHVWMDGRMHVCMHGCVDVVSPRPLVHDLRLRR